MEKNNDDYKSNGQSPSPFSQTYFHGTKADLRIGDVIEVGFNSNYGQRKNAKYLPDSNLGCSNFGVLNLPLRKDVKEFI